VDDALRDHFDRLLERELEKLPPHILRLLEEAPLVVDDQPSDRLVEQLGLSHPNQLCGLYHGIPRTHQSVDIPHQLPESIYLFRGGICLQAGTRRVGEHTSELRRQIHITLLHEIGHHFGLTEEDLDEAGYG
jgi:predicted Zn-dependent protease with MMP-like domain